MKYNTEYEKFTTDSKGRPMFDRGMGHTKVQQYYDDMLKKEKEFASVIYLQRDQERYL